VRRGASSPFFVAAGPRRPRWTWPYACCMKLRRPGQVAQAAITLAIWPATITLSPVILLAGEPVNRYVMQRMRWSPPIAGVAVVRIGNRSARAATPVRLTLPSSLLLMAISNPLWIALTAPGRWVVDNFTRRP
jgi:hypothetical protein